MSVYLNLGVSIGLRFRSDLVGNLFPYFYQTIYLTGRKSLKMQGTFCKTLNLYFTRDNKSNFRRYHMIWWTSVKRSCLWFIDPFLPSAPVLIYTCQFFSLCHKHRSPDLHQGLWERIKQAQALQEVYVKCWALSWEIYRFSLNELKFISFSLPLLHTFSLFFNIELFSCWSWIHNNRSRLMLYTGRI
jgi:hypothetical protein